MLASTVLRGHEQRQHAGSRDEPFAWRIGPHHDPGKRETHDDRDGSACSAHDERVDERQVHIRVRQHRGEVRKRQVARVDAVDDRVRVGQRAEQQRRDWVQDQEGEQHQEGAAPDPPPDAYMGRSLGRDRQLQRRSRLSRHARAWRGEGTRSAAFAEG
jgi:hypothetical protein